MKFKIQDKYWQKVQQYLDSFPELSYDLQESAEESTSSFTIKSQTATVNIVHEIAQKLLSQFNKEKIGKGDLTLAGWLESYVKVFEPLGQQEKQSGYLNHMMMVEEFNQIKKRIAVKKEKLKRLIQENIKATQKYQKETEIEQERIRLSLMNIDYRIKLKEGNQESNEELERINSLLKNGLWGILPQIEDKLKKIETLQSEIDQIKKQKSNSN